MPSDMEGFPSSSGALLGSDMPGIPSLVSGSVGPDMPGFSGAAAGGYYVPFQYTALYSMRKRNPAYGGPCIKVRNSTTSVETDIGFGSDGWIDSALLLAAANGGSLFVTTWYDQRDNGAHATNAVVATQPRIVNAGALESMQGKPAVYFRPGAVSCKLATVASSLFGFGTGAFTIEVYCRTESIIAAAGQNGPLVNLRSGGGTGSDPAELYFSDTTLTRLHWFYGPDLAGTTVPTTLTDYVFAAAYAGGSLSPFKAFLNGGVEITGNITMDFTSSRNLTLGNDASGSWKGWIGEIAVTKGVCKLTAAYTPRPYLS